MSGRRNKGGPPAAAAANPAPAPTSRAIEGGRALETGALLLLLAIVAVTQSLALRGLVRLPSPLLGGDLWYQMGCIRSIAASLDPMASCSSSDALPGYLPLYGTLIAALVRLLHLDVLHAMEVGGVALAVVSVLLYVWIGMHWFGRTAGLVLGGLAYAAQSGWIARYTDFAGAIVAPLLLDALARLDRERSRAAAVRLGLVLAIAGYTHAVLFIGGVILFAALIVLHGVAAVRSHGRALGDWLGRTAIAGGLAMLALGYWWKPIVVHHGRTSPHYAEWNGGPSWQTLPERLEQARALLARIASPMPPEQGLVLALAVVGAALALRGRRDPRRRALGTIGGLAFLYVFHAFVTEPLLGVHFVPEYAYRLLWGSGRFFLALVAIGALAERVASAGAARAPRPALRLALAAAAIGLGIVGGARAMGDPTLANGRAPLDPLYTSLAAAIERNSRPEDVFLSSNELSFALAALTGRKVMVTRRAQNDAFLDMDARNRDAALVLYGGDDALRRRLLARYRVGWVLWTDEWPSTEFYVDPSGRVTDYDDPLLYFRSAASDSALARAGVRFAHVDGWVDPTLRGEDHPKFPLTIVTPDNYDAPRPWRRDLDRLLERVWSYEQNGRTVATLDRVRIGPSP